MISDVGQFLSSVFWRWQSWAGGGGVGGAVLVIIALWERWSGRSMDKRMYFSIIIGAFMLGAFFMAWRDQAMKVRALEKRLNSPELQGEISGVWIGPAPAAKNAMMVLSDLNITNPYGPSTSLDRFTVRVENGNRKFYAELPGPSPQALTIDIPNSRRQLNIRPEKWLPGMVSSNPIPAGGEAAGWIISYFEGVDFDIFASHDTTLVVTCTSIVGGKTFDFRAPIPTVKR